MAKLTLGARPKNFKRVINVELPEGGSGSIEVSYIYRTRTEFGAFVDDLFGNTGVKPESESDADVKFSLKDALQKAGDSSVDYIMKIVDGWNLDEDFSRDSVAQLCDELPGAALEIMNVYRMAITEGRRGN